MRGTSRVSGGTVQRVFRASRVQVLVAVLALSWVVRPGEAQSTSGQAAVEGRQIVLVTGSTDGLGREVALRIAATGAHVIVHGRNLERGAEVVAQIEAGGKGTARFYPADLASVAGVRAFGEAILRDYSRLDVLINNAGIALFGQEERLLSPDGQELHFAINYLAGFQLTHMLLPVIRSSAPARIINVASIGQAPLDFDNITLDRGYTVNRAYGQSKLAQIMFTIDLAHELEGTGVVVYSVHPATLMNTSMILEAGIQPRSTIDDGASAVTYLVTTPGLDSGQFFNQMTPARANAQAYDAEVRARLRTLSEKLTGTG